MQRARTIVGLGDAVLVEQGDRDVAGGLASGAALAAVALNQRGVAVSRLGQDDAGARLRAALQAAGVSTDHLQSDPDLATPREVRRAIGGRRAPALDAAFDNLQWDFDLADLAQTADAVIFGLAATRTGQARSVIERFLSECRIAIRALDVARDGGPIDRSIATRLLGFADVVIADEGALATLAPALVGATPTERARDLLRTAGAAAIVIAPEGKAWIHVTRESELAGPPANAAMDHDAAVAGLVYALSAGRPPAEALELAHRCGAHAHAHPGAAIPESLLES